MKANRPGNFDDMLHNASGRRELKPNQRVWKGIASHFEKVERKRRIWQGSIVVSFALISTFSAIYFSIPNTPIAATLPQLNGKEIIEQHFGGSISVESQLGVGSTFSFIIPLVFEPE